MLFHLDVCCMKNEFRFLLTLVENYCNVLLKMTTSCPVLSRFGPTQRHFFWIWSDLWIGADRLWRLTALKNRQGLISPVSAGSAVRRWLSALSDSETPVRALLGREIAAHQTYLPLPWHTNCHPQAPTTDPVVGWRRLSASVMYLWLMINDSLSYM